MLSKIVRLPARSVLIAAAFAGVSACSDPLDPIVEPDVAVAYMVLRVDGSPTVLTLTKGQTGVLAVTRTAQSSTNITTEWMNAARHVLPAAATAELELSVSGATFTIVTRTRTGIISGLEPGLNVVQISVLRSGDGQIVFGVTLNITVIPACTDCGDWDY